MASHKYGEIHYGVKLDVDNNGLKNIKADLLDLKNSLHDIQKQASLLSPGTQLSSEFNEAAQAAEKLGAILSESWNGKLNQLDLTKFNRQLTQSFGTMQNLQNVLKKAGDAGTNSFNQLTRSILHSNMELKETSTLLNKMSVTMSNTIRFGISSSIFNNLTNAISKSYNYVLKLDKSLNDIRIVTGQSADQMEKFAKQANNAAQSLGATTLDYTKASLIYYQQGLSDSEVAARTETTVKMANVLGTSAQEVSDYMTAIWNNFAEGSTNLEYFADVITALGAATASSSEEIAEGLNKFAAVADTVGLSYEYATSALATVVAQTRQSADVVGTAFKTLFARIQDLELGKTLDDGTTLGKYAEALQKVGINIKDQRGELKKMDDILNEMGSKWNDLGKSQQVALAQNVAGTRQYTQLIALMDNWGEFQNNLEIATDSTGTLQEQQDIYLDSVEAHLNKLTAASERLYDDIFDEDTIKTFADALTGLLGIADNLVQGLGGGLNSFVYFGSILGNVFNNQIGGAINRQIINMERLGAAAEAVAQKTALITDIKKTRDSEGKQSTQSALELEAEYAQKILNIRNTLSKEEYNELTIRQKEIGDLQNEIDLINQWKESAKDILGTTKEEEVTEKRLQDVLEEGKKALETREVLINSIISKINSIQQFNLNGEEIIPVEKFTTLYKVFSETETVYARLAAFEEQRAQDKTLSEEEQKRASRLVDEYTRKMSEAQALGLRFFTDNADSLDNLEKSLLGIRGSIYMTEKELEDTNLTEEQRQEILGKLEKQKEEEKGIIEEIFNIEKQLTISDEEEKTVLQGQTFLRRQEEEYVHAVENAIKGVKQNEEGVTKEKLLQLELLKQQEDEEIRQKERQQQISKIISGFSTLASVFTSGKGILNTWFGDNDLSLMDKITQSMTVMASTLPILINGWANLKELIPTVAAMLKIETMVELENGAVKQKNILIILKEIAAKLLDVAATKLQVLWETILKIITMDFASVSMVAVAAIVAIVAITGVWIAKMILANTEEARLQKEIERTAESVKRAKEAYKELKDTVTSYTDARKNIDDLTEGTIEFYEAVIEANEKAEELIKTLGLLPGNGYTIDANGLINIDEDVIQNELYKKQQEIYRNQARNDVANMNLEIHNRDKIVSRFQRSVNNQAKQQGFSSYITKEQAELMLKNSFQITTDIGLLIDSNEISNKRMIEKQEETRTSFLLAERDNAEQITESVKTGTITITDSMKSYLAQYNAATSRIESYQSRAVRNDLAGYLNQDAYKEYLGTSAGSQDAIVKIMGLAKDASRPGLQYNTNNTFLGQDVYDAAQNVKWYNPFTWGAWMGNQLAGDYIGDVKKEYAKQALGYKQDEKTGAWYTSDQRPVSDSDMKIVLSGIDVHDAMAAWNSGEYSTAKNYNEKIKPTLDKAKNLVSKNKLDSSSESYITEALLRLQAGTFDDEFAKKLTNEEKAILNKNREGGSQTTFYKNTKTGKEWSETTEYNTVGGVQVDTDISSEQINKWLALNKEVDRSVERIKADLQDYNYTLDEMAKDMGTSTEALQFYGIAMYNANKETNKMDKAAAEAIANQYKFNKAYNEAVEIYYDNEDAIKAYDKALKNGEDIAYDVADAMGELSKSLKEMGLSLSAETISEHLEDVKKLLTGNKKEAEEAYQALLKLAQLDTLKSIFGPEAKDQVEKYGYSYQQLIDAINNTEAGTYLAKEYGNALSQMIQDTELTISQINELADGLNITIPVEYKVPDKLSVEDKAITTKATSVLHRYKGEMPNPAWDGKDKSKQKVNIDYTWVETTEDKTDHFLVPKATEFTVNKDSHSIGGGRNFTPTASNAKSQSGSGKDEKPDKMDPIKAEIDRYHKVNTQITKVDNSLKKLQSQQEKFVGSKLINNLNKQWELLNTQISNYNEKLRIANQEQAELANKLSNKGVQFNADGTVANYAESVKAQEAYVNSLIDKYNSMSKAQQESYKDTVEQAKKEFDEFKENIDRYDELVSDFIPDLKQSVQDAIDKQIEINVQKFNMEIEITLDMDQATRDWNQWVKKAMDGIDDENILGNAQARVKDFYTYFNEQNNGDAQVGTRHVNDILAEMYKMDNGQNNVYGDNRKQALEDLKTYYTQLMESITDVIDLQEELHQAVLDEMDEVQAKFDKQVDSYQYLRDIINHDMKVIQLTLGEDAYGEMIKFYKMQEDNYEKQLDFQRQQKDFWYAQMIAAEEGSKEWESAREKWQNAVNEFNSILEEGLENAKAKFENAINDIFDRLNKSITKGMGLDYVNTEWDLINQNAERYLDTVNATYAIRQLEKKYINDLNKMDNTAAQQKLKTLMDEQLANLKERERITQYDIDRANKLYEIELARIALEEAQQNKSQMRLRRDSQGNYSYQYVADNDAVAEAEDKVNALYNDLYNFDKERYNNVLNDIYDIWDNYQQSMAEAALINDPELRAEKERLIQEQYNELMLQAEEDYQVSKYNLDQSFFWDWVDLQKMSLEEFKNLTVGEKESIKEEMIPTWKNALTEMADAFAGDDGFARVTTGAWNEMQDAQQVYTDDTKQLETISGQTFEAIANGEDESIKKAQELIKDNEELIDAYDRELKAVQAVYTEVKRLRDMFKEQEEAAKKAAEAGYRAMQKDLNQQQTDARNQTQTTSSSNSNNTNTSSNSSSNSGGGAGSGGSGGNGSPDVGDVVTYNGGRYYGDSYGGSGSGSRGSGTQVKITIVKNGRPYPIHIATTDGGALGWIRQDQISGYDTGGYTGDWAKGGKLGVLHQKELVLNAQDTENMLNAVAIMRTLAYSLGSNMLARMAGATASGISGGNGNNGALEQNVHIDAQFPNVHNAAEIEQALNNLVNAASQRAMEYK